jgi:hypothetical protein
MVSCIVCNYTTTGHGASSMINRTKATINTFMSDVEHSIGDTSLMFCS